MNSVYLEVTTDVSGDGTATTPEAVNGLVYSIEWIDGTFDDGVDAVFEITENGSGVDKTILTLTDANDDEEYFVREAEHDNAGSALATYAYPVANGKVKLTVSSGGNAATGGAIVNFFKI